MHKIDKKSGKKRDETRFYITSLTSDTRTLHDYAQKHWAIEKMKEANEKALMILENNSEKIWRFQG